MYSLWHDLFANLAVLALFVAGWTHAQFWLEYRSPLVRKIILGLIMGTGAVASMLMTVRFQPGVFIDMRSSLLAVAGLFGGPIAATIAVAIAAAYRIWLGGAGAMLGLLSLVTSTLAGVLLALVCGGVVTRRHVVTLAVLVSLINAGAFLLLPGVLTGEAVLVVGLPFLGMTFLSTLLVASAISHGVETAAERYVLREALAQAPDFQFVKNRRGQFLAVNHAVAKLNGFAAPTDLVGLTDHDIVEPARAERLFEAEQQLMATGVPINDAEEQVATPDGVLRWYSTSKVPLRNAAGDIIGLAGVTHDVTALKRIETELIHNRDMLAFAFDEMSDGVAMFGADGRLVYSNEQYRGLFPRTGPVRQAGVHIRDILRAVVDTGEQVTVPNEFSEAWIEQTTAQLFIDGNEEVQLFDGSWLNIRTRPTSNGATIVIVSDITATKRELVGLAALAEEMKTLASTDGLTGLFNRRTFDELLEAEIGISLKTDTYLSVLMIDVDRFKAYNDLYGHPAGDECLRVVARCLAATLGRSVDIAARYGGEEFAAILPGADENVAYRIAEKYRGRLAALALPHRGSDRGVVTVSTGIATYAPGLRDRSAAAIVRQADEALYGAKTAGRDRINGWHPVHPIGLPQRTG